MASEIILFTDSQYGGTAKFLNVGRYDMASLGIPNDSLSSLRVPAGMKVTLYQHPGFTGKSMVCVADTPYVGNSVNDSTSALVVEEYSNPKVILYTDSNFGGWTQELDVGQYQSLSIGNDTLSSLRVPAGFRVTLWADGLGTGSKMICVADLATLGDNWGDRVSAVTVETITDPQVIIYTESNFTGVAAEVPVGRYSSVPIGNDCLSSLKVPAGYKVTLWQHGLDSGKKMIVTADTPQVGASVNDQVSAIVVEKGIIDKVVFYTDSNYTGWCEEMNPGNHSSLSIGNDCLSSLRVPAGLKVTLWESNLGSGRSMVCVMDTPNLGNVNDKTSAAQIESLTNPKVILYNDTNYTGWSCEYATGDFELSVSIGNDRVSSAVVPMGFKVTLCENAALGGKQRILVANSSSLPGFDDKATSMRVQKMQVAPAPTDLELKQLIERFGPRYYVHSAEKYGPGLVTTFLSQATLHCLNNTWRPANSEPLPEGGGDDGLYWLELDSQYRGGNLNEAIAYVNAKYYQYFIDLQFWIFYPYNGAGQAEISSDPDVGPGRSEVIDLDPMGQHGGDFEHCTVRLELANLNLLGVYMAAHSGGEWASGNDLEKEGDRPVVYSSLNGHGAYKSAGVNGSEKNSVSIGVGTVKFQLLNLCEKSTKVLDCNTKYSIVRTQGFLDGFYTLPTWLKYCRRWGPHKFYDHSSLRNSIKDPLNGLVPGASLGDLAADSFFDAMPSEFKEENGPSGPNRKGTWEGME